MEVPAEQAARGRPWPWPERRRVSIYPSSSAGSAAGAWSRGGVEQGRGVDARRCAAPPPAPHRCRARARVGAVLSPIFVAALLPTSGSALSPPFVRGTVPVLPLHGVCGDLPPRLERLGWRVSAWARRPIRASRRIQAERDAAGFGVAAAERNHCVQFGVPRCSLKNGKNDLEVALPALSTPCSLGLSATSQQ
jgi:hypothetical protein